MKKLFTTLILLLAVALNLPAQNVYISPQTGHLIAAVTYDSETGFQNGFSALWRHNQLGLSMVVADGAELTTGQEIANPAGNLNIVNGKLTLTGGQPSDCFIVVSLPKGYRFTSYSLVLNNDMNGYSYARDFNTGNISKWFYETGSTFDYNNPKAQGKTASGKTEMSGRNDNDDYTITRSADDMGNRLFFRLHKDPNIQSQYYGVSIKSFVVHFAADVPFEQPLQALPTTTAVGVEKSPFMVGKPELGTIRPNTKNGKTYFSYNYRNVDDLEADNLLYQSNAVVNGKADDSNLSNKTISRTIYNQHNWFALKKGSAEDNTYYVETPVTLLNAKGKEYPIGYRITGAKFEFTRGGTMPTTAGYTIASNRHGNLNYLHSDGTMGSTNPETGWTIRNGRLYLNGTQIYVARNRNNVYYLTPSSNGSRSATFYRETDNDDKIYAYVNAGYLNTIKMYIHESEIPNGQAVLNTDDTFAAQLKPYSAITPSASGFNVTVFGKTGKDNDPDNKTISVTNDNVQTIELTGLNNDAVKFKIDGLDDNSQALVRVTLTMQHLNPYIHSMDVIGKDVTDDSKSVSPQTFTADNFSIRGGHFEFNVPKDTKNHYWKFEFDNLTSNYTDATYAQAKDYHGSTNGNARIAFVNSAYFPATQDGKYQNLYDTNPNADPNTKLSVKEVGTVPYRFNNADQLSNENITSAESELEEYPFSVKNYLDNTGYNDENGAPVKGSFAQLTLGGNGKYENVAYIITSDETRYNIAPTTATEHRYYAHYVMDIEIEEAEYDVDLTAKKVYDKTFFINKFGDQKECSMWGIKVNVKDKQGNAVSGGGFANLSDVLDAISALCANSTNGNAPTDMSQILYVDMSELSNVILPSDQEQNTYLNAFRNAMAPNCLIYMPQSNANHVDNLASRSDKNGSFSAHTNIVLVDKMPFFAPYAITVNNGYAKYTRETSHSTSSKSHLSSIVLPFEFTVSSTDGTHTNKGNAADGKTFTVYKLSKTNAVCPDKGDPMDGFNENLVSSDNNVHFDKFLPKSEAQHSDAYIPYLIYIDDENQLKDDENFTVLEYNTVIEPTKTETTANGTEIGKQKIVDENSMSAGNLEGKRCSLTPTATMSGYKIPKEKEPSLYFASDRFRSSWTLNGYDYVYCQPFRSWFTYDCGTYMAKDNYYGIAFGFDGEATGIDDIKADDAEKTGTYKFLHNGQLYIHTDNGVFTVDGRKVNL